MGVMKQCQACKANYVTDKSKPRNLIGYYREEIREFYRRLPISLYCDDCLLKQIVAEFDEKKPRKAGDRPPRTFFIGNSG